MKLKYTLILALSGKLHINLHIFSLSTFYFRLVVKIYGEDIFKFTSKDNLFVLI